MQHMARVVTIMCNLDQSSGETNKKVRRFQSVAPIRYFRHHQCRLAVHKLFTSQIFSIIDYVVKLPDRNPVFRLS